VKKAADIGKMRTKISSILKKYPELEDIVDDVNEELWALELALELESKRGDKQ
jgi:hypothetical protein